jgi:hypothetical protein
MMNRDLMARQMFANGGAVPSDVQAIVNGLYEAMRGSNADVLRYVQENRRDLSDIAQMFPQFGNAISQALSQRLGPQSSTGAEAFVNNPRMPVAELERLATMLPRGMDQMMTPVDPPQGGVTREFIPPGPDGVDPGYGAQNNAPLSPEDLDTLRRSMQRNQALEDQEQKSFGMRPPPPPPPAALPGIPMALGGEPMAAAMGQMGGDPMAGMMGGDPMAAMGAPPPADLGSATTTEGIASQIDPQIAQIIQGAAQNFGDPETAENAEQMMNMVRGDKATVEERRAELGEMVGPEDAAQTPESVLALVQPVLMMASMDMGTDTDTGGIGPMAQEAMNVPVTGDMAGGIMSMAGVPPEPEVGVPPVNFNQGGEVLRFNKAGLVPRQPFPTGPRRAYAASPQLALQAGMPLAAPAAAPAAAPKDLAALAKERAEVYRGIVGGGDAAGDKDLAQAQFYTDLAKFGFGLMQAPKPEEAGSTFSLAQAGRVANEVGLGQNTLTLMAKQREARKAADRQLNLAALTSSEAEMTADAAADAALAKAQATAASKRVAPSMHTLSFKNSEGETVEEMVNLATDAGQARLATLQGAGTRVDVFKVGEKKTDQSIKGIPKAVFDKLPEDQQARIMGLGPNMIVLDKVLPSGAVMKVAVDTNNLAPGADGSVPVLTLFESRADDGDKLVVDNLILKTDEARKKWGNGAVSTFVRIGQDGKVYAPSGEAIDFSDPIMMGAYLPGRQAVSETIDRESARARNSQLVQTVKNALAIGNKTGKYDLFGAEENRELLTQQINVGRLSSFTTKNGKVVKTDLSKKDRESLSDAVAQGVGFWPSTRVLLSKAFAPVGILSAEEENAAKNALMHTLILGRDAFVSNPKYPVREMELVEKLFVNPEKFFVQKVNELKKLKMLKSKLVDNVNIARGVLKEGSGATAEEQTKARDSLVKSFRVLNLLGNLGSEYNEEAVKEVIKNLPPLRESQ